MFGRFTPQAREIVRLAEEESDRLSHNYLGTEHVLVGIAQQAGSAAARRLRASGLDPDATRAELDRLVSRGSRRRGAVTPFCLAAWESTWRRCGAARDAESPARWTRRTRRVRAYLGFPSRPGPDPVRAVIEARGGSAERLREAVLAELRATPLPEQP